jgi:DNA polymerase III subunit gamma/tau
MLATTQPEDIPQTIRSRCQHFSFRAVRFDEIVGQLRDLVGRENIAADDDALALLAEAGDGSMRDALSILDQAIASTTSRLTADSVRQLVGAVPSEVLEEVMQAVSRSSSEDVLRLADRLISEGQNPVHFARQLVRFLRNAVVAKVAGRDSSLLQISGDERARVARIAELFGEEDLARHLQIMLRTHGELGYKQEQRFHLELGLLKMAHAQRLLPIEQLLSDVAGAPAAGAPARVAGRPSIVSENRAPSSASARGSYVSPFAADSARKGGAKSELSGDSAVETGPRIVTNTTPPAPVIMGSAVPEAIRAERAGQEVALQHDEDSREGSDNLEAVRDAVLSALVDAGQPMLVSMLETGEWALEGNELVIKVAASAAVIDMSLGAEARRLAIITASGMTGKAMKLKVLSGGTAQAAPARQPAASNGGERARAEQDPIVRRLQEKFGAEIRTIIDQRDKK